MFDCEKQIQLWRNRVAGDLGERPDLMDELESHLRDDFERRVKAGQSESGAWEQALLHLGDSKALAGEFAKLSGPRWIPAWVAGIGLALCVVGLAWIAISGMTSGRFGLVLATHIVSISTGYIALFAAGFLAVWAVAVHAAVGWNDRQTAAFRTAGIRLALLAVVATGIGVVFGAWWSHDHLGQWWGWGPKEIGGLSVLAWSVVLLQCFRSRTSTLPTLMSMATVGNVVVCLSWFGPGLLNGASYGHPSSLYNMLVGAFLMCQFLAIHLSLQPVCFLRLNRFRVG